MKSICALHLSRRMEECLGMRLLLYRPVFKRYTQMENRVMVMIALFCVDIYRPSLGDGEIGDQKILFCSLRAFE